MLSLLISLCLCNPKDVEVELRQVYDAICLVESGGDPQAVGDGGRAVGIAQVHPILVRDVARILGKEKYTLADRRDPAKSWEMFKIYSLHYAPHGPAEKWAKNWNGGPTGYRKAATAGYWRKVRAEMERAEQRARPRLRG